MHFLLTKSFHFSASHSQSGHVYGHNYILSVTVRAAAEADEARLSEAVEKNVLAEVHSKDLGVDVTQSGLLKRFHDRLMPAMKGLEITSMALERDARTRTTLLTEKG